MTRRCALVEAGLRTYEQGLQLQKWAWDKVAAGEYDGILILLEHLPTVTMGREYNDNDLLWSMDEYRSQSIEVVHCKRGGKITCHNPGQLVGYPILNLAQWKQDTHWYLRLLEQNIMDTVQLLGQPAKRKQDYTGVWIDSKKVAAIGVAIRRWITSHGFALNVNNDLSLFQSIVPCGISEYSVTSLLSQGVASVTVQTVTPLVIRAFEQSLQSSFQDHSIKLPDPIPQYNAV